jgi:FkbM family methyltransferase
MMPSLSDAQRQELFAIGARGGGRFPNSGELFESVIADIYGAILKPGELVVDGGANTGQHTFAMASAVGRDGMVIAIEAIPQIASILAEKVRNQNVSQVRVIAKPLYNKHARIRYNYVKNNPGHSGIEPRTYNFAATIEQIPMRTTTIDAIFRSLEFWTLFGSRRRWRFCKLDLEGGELRALQGARNALKRHRPLIVFENGQDASAGYYGYSMHEWFDFFAATQYDVFTLWGQPFTPADWGRSDIPWYFIAAPAGSADVTFVTERLPTLLVKYFE